MNTSERIFLDTGDTINDKYIKVRLENENDTFEMLTLKIDTKEAYADFNADYGVLIGRVTANEGIGIPNAKISVFIPLAEEDEEDGSIVSIYPYKTPRDKDNNGKRYNLLPRAGILDTETGIVSPKQPFGSFPIKPEIVTNVHHLNVYKKYYKHTAVTNQFGDYMIFGAPVGTQTIHLSVDITDIGKYSMNPAAMVTNLGYSPNLFTDNNTKIKPSTDLNDLPNIETQEISVDVIPFWGDTTNFEIGITRQDFRIRATLENTFTIFGSIFTDGDNSMWGENFVSDQKIDEMYRARDTSNRTISLSSKRIGKVTEKIYYYPASVSDEEINNTSDEDRSDKMLQLDSTEYSVYKRDGDFVFIINCNRRKVITGNDGSEVVVANDSTSGVFTEFKGFVTLEITDDELPMDFSGSIGSGTNLLPFRVKLKFPQYAALGTGFLPTGTAGNTLPSTKEWRNLYKTFRASNFYSFARFHSTTYNQENSNNAQWQDAPLGYGLLSRDRMNAPFERDSYNTVGIIITQDIDDSGTLYPNEDFQLPTNTQAKIGSTNYDAFGSNWLNLSVYLPQFAFINDGYEKIDDVRVNTNFHGVLKDNNEYNGFFLRNRSAQPVVANYDITKYYARSDIHWTDIIEVPVLDIKRMLEIDEKGFSADANQLEGTTYRNGKDTDCPSIWNIQDYYQKAGRINADPTEDFDPKYYFYKGFGEANCLQYLVDLGFIIP